MEKLCANCKKLLVTSDIFCGNCGKKIASEKAIVETRSVQLVIAFYIAYLVFAIGAYFFYEDSNTVRTEIIIESVFIVLTLGFCLFDRKAIIALYNTRKIDLKGIAFSLIFPIISAVVVYFGIEALNGLLFEDSYGYFESYIYYKDSIWYGILFIAILPPIFEELAFRGFLFNQLQKFASPNITIFATAILFGLIHFSFISFLWIFPFGLVLGYLRQKYNTLWLGMGVHFIHNLGVLLIEYYYFKQYLLS